EKGEEEAFLETSRDAVPRVLTVLWRASHQEEVAVAADQALELATRVVPGHSLGVQEVRVRHRLEPVELDHAMRKWMRKKNLRVGPRLQEGRLVLLRQDRQLAGAYSRVLPCSATLARLLLQGRFLAVGSSPSSAAIQVAQVALPHPLAPP
ncbi:hypothetical protein CYMTET_11252, partial [Cymbomonas tetramitiformis]